jgi:hypothetical protein
MESAVPWPSVLDGADRTQKRVGDSDLSGENDLTDLAGFV